MENSRTLVLALATALVCAALPAAFGADGPVVFNRDIRPILSENCFQCHGPDPGTRKASLRLDTQEGFFAATDKRGPTIVTGRPDESPLFKRLMSADQDEVMPPPESHKSLKPGEKEIVRRWITEGAPWQPHWSFVQPERPPSPQVHNPLSKIHNPIDAFILAKVEEMGLSPAPEADRRTLARRLSLDLIGLPPTPEEVEVLVNDPAPDWYEKYVRKLLGSTRYGEHRARYWLDAARYGDTHGMHFDNYREMWPYRDWVINAFNKNQRFDGFITEQLGGDLLPNPTLEQLIATGFQRCNITTNEGGTIVEENLANYARDRVETTAWVFLGLTANCAVCHDHKFDPITTKDFYSMSAFFRNTTQPGLDGNVKDSTPSILVPQTEEDRTRWAAIPNEIGAKQALIAQRKKDAVGEFDSWIASAKTEELGDEVSTKDLLAHAPLTEGVGDEIGAICGQPMKFKATGPVLWQPTGKLGPAPVIKAGATFDLGNQGDFEKDQPFSYGAWVKTTGTNGTAGIIARMDKGPGYRGWDLFQNGALFSVHIVSQWDREDALKVSTKKKVVKPGEWQHVFMTYDGSGKAGGVRIYIDGAVAETKSDVDALHSTIRNTVPLTIGQRSASETFEGGSVQDVRVYGRRLQETEVKSLFQSGPLRAMLAVDAAHRTPEQKSALLDYYLTTKDAPTQEAQKTIAALDQERTAIKGRNPITHVQEEKKNSMPMANILNRGNYDQPKEKVAAAVFHALHPLPAHAARNRLGLAQWLNSPENPLTARVTVNRFWQELFGTGLVKTSEDFGIMGDPPANQPLLDWLAVEFRESGWDVKHLITLMVTSAIYRQSAVTTPEKIEKDPANRLLSRGPRFRMDAEMVRDYALAASGLLSTKIGGPSVRPYQPPNVWEVVGMVEGDTRVYKQDHGENLYRRSMYSFWKRMAPPASLDIFNAPNREVACLRRERTNTPLQALVTLNDPQYIETARVLAEKALKSSAGEPDRTIDFITQRVLSRALRPEERGIVKGSLDDALSHYRAEPKAAADLLAVGEVKADPAADVPTLAAWTMIANQLMNLDEVLNK